MGTEKACYTFHQVRGQEVAVDQKRDSDNPVKKAASVVESWKVILGVIFSVIGLAIAGTVYVQSFATTDAVATSIDRHSQTDGHPSLSGGMRSIADRLLRVEITQGAMVEAQKGMDAKLDRILSVIPLVRGPVYQPAQPNP